MKYKSCVHWPSDCCPAIGNYSEDTHGSLAEAKGVIDNLYQQGFGGDFRYFPTRHEIIPIPENGHDLTMLRSVEFRALIK